MKKLIYLIVCVMTAMVGYQIHRSIFWAVIDFIFTPIALVKWLICHEITSEVIANTFDWFF